MVEKVFQAGLDFLYQRIGISQVIQVFEEYMELEESEKEKLLPELVEKSSILLDACKEIKSNVYYLYLSFLIHAAKQKALVKEFLESCIHDDALAGQTKFFLYQYIVRLLFLGTVPGDAGISELLDDLYQTLLDGYANAIGKKVRYIAKKDRNQDLVFVFTGQVLGLGHGPTKTLFDRCRILKQILKKNLYIINTAEMYPLQKEVMLFRIPIGGYMDAYKGGHNLVYENEVYPYFQCPYEMPEVSVVREILDMVEQTKPLCIVTIGGGSIVSDLCSKIVPTIVISTVPSGRVQTYGQFQAIGKEPVESDFLWAGKHGLSKEHFIRSIFTSSFKKQEHIYNRTKLSLPKNAFIAVLVGGRLGTEIGEECLQMLLKLMEQGIYIGFLGVFDRFEQLKAEHEVFEKFAISMGMQEDVLAVLECVDLYINPERVGGGTSVAEALYKGVPVVTLPYGDGGLGAGEDFHVKDYEEMYETVLRYKEDAGFYSEMSRKAKERANVLTDSETEFVKIINTAMERESFQ